MARNVWRRLEPLHAVTYFAAEPLAALADAGYRGFWMGYFAGRAAPLGPVGPDVVGALFYNFAPSRVARALPDAWAIAPPAAALDARRTGSVAALRRALGPDADGPAVEEAAALAAARGARRRRPTAAPCSPPTPPSTGRPSRSTCCGTPPRCCASTVATDTSPC